MSVFGAIEERFQADRRRGVLDAALDRWRAHHPCLLLMSDIEGLVGMCRSRAKQVKEAALVALCQEAAGGDEEARLTLAWLLLPALLRSARSLGATTTLEPEDLYGEMMLGFFSEVPKVGPGDRNIAGRLLNRATWRAREASLGALERDTHEIPVAEHAEDGLATVEGWESQAEWSALGWGLEAADIVRRAVMQGLITRPEAEILMADRRKSTELCARWGISAYAFQCRRRRVRQRLGSWFRETFLGAVGA